MIYDRSWLDEKWRSPCDPADDGYRYTDNYLDGEGQFDTDDQVIGGTLSKEFVVQSTSTNGARS